MAPTSRPRVGSSSRNSFGAVASQRANTTFCWLPPDSVAVALLLARDLDAEPPDHRRSAIRFCSRRMMKPSRAMAPRLGSTMLSPADSGRSRPSPRRSSVTKPALCCNCRGLIGDQAARPRASAACRCRSGRARPARAAVRSGPSRAAPTGRRSRRRAAKGLSPSSAPARDRPSTSSSVSVRCGRLATSGRSFSRVPIMWWTISRARDARRSLRRRRSRRCASP